MELFPPNYCKIVAPFVIITIQFSIDSLVFKFLGFRERLMGLIAVVGTWVSSFIFRRIFFIIKLWLKWFMKLYCFDGSLILKWLIWFVPLSPEGVNLVSTREFEKPSGSTDSGLKKLGWVFPFSLMFCVRVFFLVPTLIYFAWLGSSRISHLFIVYIYCVVVRCWPLWLIIELSVHSLHVHGCIDFWI